MTRIGPSMRIALEHIRENPGVHAAQVDRARRTARGGHSWMYATIGRLLRAGLVRRGPATHVKGCGAVGLYAV